MGLGLGTGPRPELGEAGGGLLVEPTCLGYPPATPLPPVE